VEGRLDDIHLCNALLREPYKSDTDFLLLGIELDDGAGQEHDKIALLDFCFHQIDGYGDGTFDAHGENTCFQTA
jgi:hypothetical protein